MEGADVGETRVSGDREGEGETGADMMPGGYSRNRQERGGRDDEYQPRGLKVAQARP